jgi:hypothetical protein
VLSFPDGVQDHIALQLLLSESWKNWHTLQII